MSRKEAKQTFTVSAFKKEMGGVFSTTVSDETLDECPMAYKSLGYIVNQIEPAVRIEKRIVPVYNFKAGENTLQRRKSNRKRDKYRS